MVASVAEIKEHDIAAVAAFLARQVRAGEAVSAAALRPEERLRWLLIDSPCRTAGIPLGWQIRDAAGAVAGAAICAPFQIGAGDFRCTALMFAKFFVAPEHRGMGVGILMRFVREGARFPLFVTSTNAVAGQLFRGVGAARINGMDHTMLGVARPRPLLEEWLHRKTGRAPLARMLSLPARMFPSTRIASGAASATGKLRPITSPEDAFLTRLPATIDALAVVRDPAYVRWRYFSGGADKDVYCFRSENEQDRLIVVNQVRSGYRGQIRVVNVLDVWPPATGSSAPPLAGALARQYRGEFDAIWLRSQPAAAEEALGRAGFVRHAFPAPLGWFIDREKRLPTENWYLTPGESE